MEWKLRHARDLWCWEMMEGLWRLWKQLWKLWRITWCSMQVRESNARRFSAQFHLPIWWWNVYIENTANSSHPFFPSLLQGPSLWTFSVLGSGHESQPEGISIILQSEKNIKYKMFKLVSSFSFTLLQPTVVDTDLKLKWPTDFWRNLDWNFMETRIKK